MNTMTTHPATTKQLDFIKSLIATRDMDSETATYITVLRARWTDGRGITKAAAKVAIDRLLACPLLSLPSAEPGYYFRDVPGGEETDGEPVTEYYVVIRNKRGTGTYAKRLVREHTGSRWVARWEYAPGIGRELADMTPLTVEQARWFGHAYGVCLICARPLTDPKSVAAGIGPVCQKKVGR